MIFTVEFQVLFAWEGTLIDSTGDVRPQQDWGFVLQVSFLKQLPAPLRAVFAFCTLLNCDTKQDKSNSLSSSWI